MGGGGRGMLGIPLVEHKKVSWFLGCWCSVFGFRFFVSWFLGFEVSKIYQVSISCFLIDIDLISKPFKMFQTNLHHLSAPVFSKNVIKMLGFRNSEIIRTICFENDPGDFLNSFYVSWFLQGFGGSGHVHKFRNHRNESFWSLP